DASYLAATHLRIDLRVLDVTQGLHVTVVETHLILKRPLRLLVPARHLFDNLVKGGSEGAPWIASKPAAVFVPVITAISFVSRNTRGHRPRLQVGKGKAAPAQDATRLNANARVGSVVQWAFCLRLQISSHARGLER